MNGKIPHIVQYQGSKRLLASQILQFFPERFDRLVEPFAGMAAVSIAAAAEHRTNRFYISDLNGPLVSVLQEAVERPEELVHAYTKVWNGQFSYGENHALHFYEVRERFNQGEQTAANMLYLLARCVKGAVRYGKNGKFNQSPDKRRHGTTPAIMAANVHAVSRLLKGKAVFSACDYRTALSAVHSGDLVYLDPPYQGVTQSRDSRYCAGVPFDAFAETVMDLKRRHISFVISYDGMCGETQYGRELPPELECGRIYLNGGTSAQSTLLGRKRTTWESLYISRDLLLTMNPMLFQAIPPEVTA